MQSTSSRKRRQTLGKALTSLALGPQRGKKSKSKKSSPTIVVQSPPQLYPTAKPVALDQSSAWRSIEDWIKKMYGPGGGLLGGGGGVSSIEASPMMTPTTTSAAYPHEVYGHVPPALKSIWSRDHGPGIRYANSEMCLDVVWMQADATSPKWYYGLQRPDGTINGSVPVNPRVMFATSSMANLYANIYDRFRFTRMRLRYLPSVGSTTFGSFGLAYVQAATIADVTTGPLCNPSLALLCPSSVYGNLWTPKSFIVRDLSEKEKMFTCPTSGETNSECYQGNLIFSSLKADHPAGSSNTPQIVGHIMIDYAIEFYGFSPSHTTAVSSTSLEPPPSEPFTVWSDVSSETDSVKSVLASMPAITSTSKLSERKSR